MNALRLRKETVPGGLEKPRQARKLLQLSRQRASRSSVLQRLRTFLTADSFMYGPMLESPSPSPPPPPVALSSDSEPHTPEKEQEQEKDGGLEDGATGEPAANRKEGDASSEKHGNNNGYGYGETPRRLLGSRSSKTSLSYQRIARPERAVPPLAATPTSTTPVLRDRTLSFL